MYIHPLRFYINLKMGSFFTHEVILKTNLKVLYLH